ncbi:MAG: Orotidine-5-phosphate decarboxylase [Patescibacteria group bacterium]|nr:Orotidine-5-phosphate decarboxylase [Patescibacteria group bacterium]
MAEIIGFRQKLINRQRKVGSLVCMGLDPIMEKCPDIIRKSYPSDWRRCARWMTEEIDASAPYILHFKPQVAHYEAIEDGRRALQTIVDHIHKFHPGIPVFLDCKRGDIDRTQQRYRIAHLEIDGVDGMNFSPYMGWECMENLISNTTPGKAIVGLCYTSNKSAREVQDVKLTDGRHYWEFIADRIMSWAEKFGVMADAGLVMAAAYEPEKGSGNIFSWHLSRCREIVRDYLWFLVPGIGTQEGFIFQTVQAGYSGPGSMSINNSSGINFASADSDFAEASARVAMKMQKNINEALGA